MGMLLYLLTCYGSMREIERIMKILNTPIENYRMNLQGNPQIGMENKNISQNLYLNKNYLLRRPQERHCYNRCTQICEKGLEQRIVNKGIKEREKEREGEIKKSFSRKLKSNRWKKRHHQKI